MQKKLRMEPPVLSCHKMKLESIKQNLTKQCSAFKSCEHLLSFPLKSSLLFYNLYLLFECNTSFFIYFKFFSPLFIYGFRRCVDTLLMILAFMHPRSLGILVGES